MMKKINHYGYRQCLLISHFKEFTTIFNKPITRSDKERRYYVLEYDVEEKGKYFENYFGTNCGRFVVTIEYPSHLSPPVAYEVNLETDEW